MTRREEARIARLLADLGHDDVISALQHAVRMRRTLRLFQTWGISRLILHPPQVVEMTSDVLEPKR